MFSQKQLGTIEDCTDIDECLHRLEFENKLAVATSRLHVQALPLYKNIFCLAHSQNIHNYFTKFMIRSDFEMRISFNNMLQLVVDSGFVSKFQKDTQIHHRTSTDIADVHSMNLTDFRFVFIFSMAFFILIVPVTILEFVIYYKAHSVYATSFWKFLDKLICGQRIYFILKPRNDNVNIP